MKKISTILIFLTTTLSQNTFAQNSALSGFKASCSVTAVDSTTSQTMSASKTEAILHGEKYLIDFPSLMEEKLKSLKIQTLTDENGKSSIIASIDGLKKRDVLMAIKIDTQDEVVSADNSEYDRKTGITHTLDIESLTSETVITIRATISNKETTYLRVVECKLLPLGIH